MPLLFSTDSTHKVFTLLLDLADLPHRLLEDGALVGLHIEAVDVAQVGRNQFGQLLDVLTLLLSTPLVTPVWERIIGKTISCFLQAILQTKSRKKERKKL